MYHAIVQCKSLHICSDIKVFCVLVQARFQTAVNVQHSTVRQTIYLFADQYPQPDNSRLTTQS